MFPPVDTKDAAAVRGEVEGAYVAMFGQGPPDLLAKAFEWAQETFEGKCGDYQAIDARYHDFEHTLQGTLCLARLLRCRHEAGGRPAVPQRMFELGLLAILLHDTGYLKKKGDAEGTGAKYTLTHVARSVAFAEELLATKGFPLHEIRAVQHMIRCTGVHVDLNRIPFQSEVERVVGYVLGTADLLGQMSAPDYIEKLPILYAEFEESARFYEGKMTGTLAFESAEELMRRTPEFWDSFVMPKLERDLWGMHKFLARPYPHGANEYVRGVEGNVQKLRERLARTSP